MTLVQFLVIGFVILILIKTVSDFRKKRIGMKLFIFWFLIWVMVAIVAALPYITAPLAKILGIGRGVDVMIYFSILFIFFVLFQIISKLTKIDKDITEIVQYLSLKNPKKK